MPRRRQKWTDRKTAQQDHADLLQCTPYSFVGMTYDSGSGRPCFHAVLPLVSLARVLFSPVATAIGTPPPTASELEHCGDDLSCAWKIPDPCSLPADPRDTCLESGPGTGAIWLCERGRVHGCGRHARR